MSYDLEYGSASVELQSNAFEFCQKGSKNSSKARILVVDDLMATGGTMKAACDVLNTHAEAEVTHAFVVMELAFLQGKSKLPSSVNYHSLISYEWTPSWFMGAFGDQLAHIKYTAAFNKHESHHGPII